MASVIFSNPSFLISPVIHLLSKTVEATPEFKADAELNEQYSLSATIAERAGANGYFEYLGLNVQGAPKENFGYILVNDHRRWCEIFLTLPAETFSLMMRSVEAFGFDRCQIEASIVFSEFIEPSDKSGVRGALCMAENRIILQQKQTR